MNKMIEMRLLNEMALKQKWDFGDGNNGDDDGYGCCGSCSSSLIMRYRRIVDSQVMMGAKWIRI